MESCLATHTHTHTRARACMPIKGPPPLFFNCQNFCSGTNILIDGPEWKKREEKKLKYRRRLRINYNALGQVIPHNSLERGQQQHLSPSFVLYELLNTVNFSRSEIKHSSTVTFAAKTSVDHTNWKKPASATSLTSLACSKAAEYVSV